MLIINDANCTSSAHRFWLAVLIMVWSKWHHGLSSRNGAKLAGIHPSSRLVATASEVTRLLPWIERVNDALRNTNAFCPFLAYGTDSLAFAHLAIAIAFVRPYIDPVHNKCVVTFGLIACAGVVPLVSSPMPSVVFRSHDVLSTAASASFELSHSFSPGNQSMLSRRLREIFRLLPRAVRVSSHGIRESFIQRTFGRRAFSSDPSG